MITGAGGFIGSRLHQMLAADPALTVMPATRDGRGGSRRLDLRAPVADALAGIDAVVHCAVGDRTVTVEGTRALLTAAASAGVGRFVHISSIAVYGAATGAVREDAATVDPAGQGYAAWKAAAEQACTAQTGLETVRLRPTIVYGPGGTQWVSQIARRIRSGRWGTFAGGEGTCNLVHVDDVAGAVAAALSAPGAAGQAFNVDGPEQVTWNQWFTRLAQAIGAPPLRRMPPGLMKARAYAALPVKAAGRLRPGIGNAWLLGAPSRSELTLFALHATYPVDAARAALGWSPVIGVADGLASCIDWLRHERLAA